MKHKGWYSIVLLTTTLVACNQQTVKTETAPSTVDYKGIQSVSKQNGRRIALVIGNSGYAHASQLRSPINDASDVSSALQDLQFDQVIDYYDASKADMQNGVKRFINQLGKNDVAFFYFSGHGLQLNGKNYLIPVEANLDTEETDRRKLEKDVDSKALAAEDITDSMAKAKTSIVVLDACRNQLLPPGSKSLKSPRNPLWKGDLAPIARSVSGGEMSVIYATTHGKPAFDGKGRNSLFTKHLVKALKNNLTVNQLVQQVKKAVRIESERDYGESQIPWTYDSLTEDVCLGANCQSQSTTVPLRLDDEAPASPSPMRRGNDTPPPPI